MLLICIASQHPDLRLAMKNDKQLRSLRSPFYRSLTRNMMVAILVVSFIPVFLVGSTVYYHFYASYREKVCAHLKELVQKHQQHIDDFLREKLANIRALAQSAGYPQLSDALSLQNQLTNLQRSYGRVFVDLGVVNEKGVQVAYAGPFKLGKADYSDTEWFLQTTHKDYVISDVFLGLRGMPHFIVAVKGTHEGIPWILRATIDFVAFNTLVENIRMGETGFAYILNRKGQFQTKPRIDFTPSKNDYRSFFDTDKGIKGGVAVEEREGAEGKIRIYVASVLKDKEWLLVYRQESADAFSDLRKAVVTAIVIFILGGIGIVIMATLLSVRMVRRIEAADREKELMNQQVIESGKLAAVGELAAGIAHEINNPVAIMVEEANWIQDLIDDDAVDEFDPMEEFKRAIGQINNQGKRCKEITHKLLSFARKTDSRIQEVSLNDLITDVVELSAQRAKYAKVTLNTHLAEDLPTTHASPSEMQQVFLNLINNALDAMENQGGEITLTTRMADGRVAVDVADTGPGVPEVNLERIFDPFFTTKPVGKGTGLGLSICYGIIKKMEGDIQVKSQMGKGTTFTLLIPGRMGQQTAMQTVGCPIPEDTEEKKEKENEDDSRTNGHTGG